MGEGQDILRRLLTLCSADTLKREKFQEILPPNNATVDVHLVVYWGIDTIRYRRGLYCCSFSSIGNSHGLRVWIGQLDGSRFFLSFHVVC